MPAERVKLLTVTLLAAAAPLAAQPGFDDSRAVVRRINFDGNRTLEDFQLGISIATTEDRFFNEREFRRDVLRLRALYRQSGFVEATVDARVDTVVRGAQVAVGPGGATDTLSKRVDVFVTFRIYEGEPVRVTALEIAGLDGFVAEREVRRRLPLAAGDPFDRRRFLAAADTIRAILRDRGYPFAEVYRSFDENRAARQAQIAYAVEPGPVARVGRVEIVGAEEIGEDVIRRRIAVREGQRFSQRVLYETQLDLYRMGVFQSAEVALVDSVAAGPSDTLVTVRVRVTEGPLRRVRLGAGYGTVDCFRTIGSWSTHNFMGGGREVELNARVWRIGAGEPLAAGFEQNVCRGLVDEDSSFLKLNYNLSVSLREPFFFSRRTGARVSLFAERSSEFKAFLREAVGGDVALTRDTRWDVPVTLSYALASGRTLANPATLCSFFNVCRAAEVVVLNERRLSSSIGLSAVRRRTNSVVDPSDGTVTAVELRHASRFIGSDSLNQFHRGVLEVAAYYPAGRQSTVALRVRIGAVAPLSAPLALGGEIKRFVPPEARFYAGGPTTVRGFAQNELGPVVRVLDTMTTNGALDSVIQTSPVGGNALVLVNAEYRFPIPVFAGRLSGALFVDAGQVYEEGGDVAGVGRLRITPGAGVRVASPLGPVRLDLALNPHPPEASDLYLLAGDQLQLVASDFRPQRGVLGLLRLHFSVGQAF